MASGAPSASSLPGVSEVRFADLLDGWVFGPALFATHDGARTWQQVTLGGSVVALETSGDYVDPSSRRAAARSCVPDRSGWSRLRPRAVDS